MARDFGTCGEITVDGSGATVTSSATSTIIISSGATGTILTIPCPSGKRISLTSLASIGTTLTSLTTIAFAGVDVVTDVIVVRHQDTPALANQFKIGFENPNQTAINGNIDEDMTILTDVATSADIAYAYQVTS